MAWMRASRTLVVVLALGVALLPVSVAADGPSGQVAFGQATVEPALDAATGATVFLLTPDRVPFPSESNPRASAPMDIPMYPMGSGFSASDLNCQPTNCDHLNVLPIFLVDGLTAVYPISAGDSRLCAHFNPIAHWPAGTPCAPVVGHDHIIGVKPTGDFNVAWHVRLWLFTSVPETRVTNLSDLLTRRSKGEVIGPIDTPITFNCSIVSESVYNHGTPLSF